MVLVWSVWVIAIAVHLVRLYVAMDFTPVVMFVLVATVGVQMDEHRRRGVDWQRQAQTKDQAEAEHSDQSSPTTRSAVK